MSLSGKYKLKKFRKLKILFLFLSSVIHHLSSLFHAKEQRQQSTQRKPLCSLCLSGKYKLKKFRKLKILFLFLSSVIHHLSSLFHAKEQRQQRTQRKPLCSLSLSGKFKFKKFKRLNSLKTIRLCQERNKFLSNFLIHKFLTNQLLTNIFCNTRSFIHKSRPNLYQTCTGIYFFNCIFTIKNATTCNDWNFLLCLLR